MHAAADPVPWTDRQLGRQAAWPVEKIDALNDIINDGTKVEVTVELYGRALRRIKNKLCWITIQIQYIPAMLYYALLFLHSLF